MIVPRTFLRGPRLAAVLAAALSIPLASEAVYLNPDGLGQALIYPYYTVQAAQGQSFNTYLSVVNTTAKAKVVRVRFREGRNARSVTEFNLYLDANDVWTGALVPSSSATTAPALLVTRDESCTNPPIEAAGHAFTNFLYTGVAADGQGEGLDRTREGYFEMIEMGTLAGTAAAAAAHAFEGPVRDCPSLQGATRALSSVEAPEGGLMGSLTLINVANGMDFTYPADALAELSAVALYKPPSDPGPDFNAPEITPVSHVMTNGHLYRSEWARPVDAVSATLMRARWDMEYVLDNATLSNTDVVFTLPTRQHYVTSTEVRPPFLQRGGAACAPGDSGEALAVAAFNRESRGPAASAEFTLPPPPPPPPTFCAATNVLAATNGATHTAGAAASRVFGSLNRVANANNLITSTFQNGWIAVARNTGNADVRIDSLASSTRTHLATGDVTTGPHTFRGLPITGFWARTFQLGALLCNAFTCQGNYGSAMPLAFRRSVSP